MPNTSLPTVQVGTTGRIAQTNIVHEEINRMSRDTGWRNVLNFLSSGWTASAARIRRVDDRVTLQITGLSSATSTSPLVLPLGSDESTEVSANFGPDISGGWRLQTFEASTGRVQFYGTNTTGLNAVFFEGTTLGTGFTLQLEWTTYRAWPSFLPPAA